MKSGDPWCELSKVEDLYFLHLSDLHISGCLNRTLYKLLEDIGLQLRNVRYLIIVVTGDFACAGDVSGATDLIVFFFQKIRDVIPGNCAILDIELTPGNHDVGRPEKKNGYNAKTYRYTNNDYMELEHKIRQVFASRISGAIKRYAKGTSAITVLQYGVHKLCILNVDSSWFATREELIKRIRSEYGKNSIHVTKHQEKIVNSIIKQTEVAAKAQRLYLNRQYKRLQRRHLKFDLIIAISHFPITWMLKSCEQSIRGFLEYRGMSDVDIWMCGHVHNAQLYFNNEDNRSTTMLMTGIGRPDYEIRPSKGVRQRVNDTYQLQRYSIYQMSHERNVCSVQVRVSKRGEDFVRDDKFYRSSLSAQYNYLCLPLKTDVPGGFIRLNSFDNKDSKGLYVDYDTLSGIKEIGQRMVVFNERMQREMAEQFALILWILKDSRQFSNGLILRNLVAGFTGVPAKFNETWKHACLYVIRNLNLFREFLVVLSSALIEVFTQYILEEMPIESDYIDNKEFQAIGWRVHFRKYVGDLSSDHKVILNDELRTITTTVKDQNAKVLPWGGLIEGAMRHKDKCLINSVANIPNHIPTKWSDFLTAVPIFDGNIEELKLYNGKTAQRPIISFAVSMKISNYAESVVASKVLYLLEFFNINYVISRMIQSYFQFFSFDKKDIYKIIKGVE